MKVETMVSELNKLESALISVDSDYLSWIFLQKTDSDEVDYTYYDDDFEKIDGGIWEERDLLGTAAVDILKDVCESEKFRIKKIYPEEEAEEILEDLLEEGVL